MKMTISRTMNSKKDLKQTKTKGKTKMKTKMERNMSKRSPMKKEKVSALISYRLRWAESKSRLDPKELVIRIRKS